jgi:hypothetical protein
MLHAFLRHLCGPGPEKRKKKEDSFMSTQQE